MLYGDAAEYVESLWSGGVAFSAESSSSHGFPFEFGDVDYEVCFYGQVLCYVEWPIVLRVCAP